MWTYEYMESYVTQKVLDTAGDPSLDVYRANDTICEAGNYTTVSAHFRPSYQMHHCIVQHLLTRRHPLQSIFSLLMLHLMAL